MQIDLSADEMRTLRAAIDRAVKLMENELVHTEARELRHALNGDYEKLVALRDRFVGDGRTTPLEGRIRSTI
jgi:hypothetical protein